jgi:hypothetical protein
VSHAESLALPLRRLALLLLGAVALRLVGSVVSGALNLAQTHAGFDHRVRVGNALMSFGAAGDTVGVALVIGAALLLRWADRSDGAGVVRALLLATALLVVVRTAGVLLIVADFPPGQPWAQEAQTVAFAAADLLLCVGAWQVLARGPSIAMTGVDSGPEPVIFAVDRGNGEVFAFFSYAETARTLSIYSIEDHEFDFFSDEGHVIRAVVESGRLRFEVTDDNQGDQLMSALRHFASAHDLAVADVDDATAYVLPISDWQWLELWPGWMRGLGRLVNRWRR